MKRLLYLLIFLPLFANAQIKVSDMTSASSVADADIFLLVQSGASKKVAYSVFKYTDVQAGAQISDSLDNYTSLDSLAYYVLSTNLDDTLSYYALLDTLSSYLLDTEVRSDISDTADVLRTNTIWGLSASEPVASTSLLGDFAGVNNTGQTPTFIGSYAGYSNSGRDIVLTGYRAGYNNSGDYATSTGNYSGDENTGANVAFFGYGAGHTNTGANSSFFGYESGKLASGAQNAGYGKWTLYRSTGLGNTGLGTYAGYNNLTTGISGANNTFIGYNSSTDSLAIVNSATFGANATVNLDSSIVLGDSTDTYVTRNLIVAGTITGDIVTPGNNTEIFFNNSGVLGTSSNFTWDDTSLVAVSSIGSANIFIGTDAGKVRSSGNSNTVVGEFSGDAMTTASSNTFLGNGSGGQNTNGGSNVLIGADAGKTITAGSQNVMIGQGAGGLTTGSRNVFLGIASGTNESGSDKLYIENSNSATPLIYGDFTQNYVEINDSLGVAKSITLGENTGENYKAGKLYYDTTDQSLEFFNDIPDFTHQLGYEHVVRFYNNTGGTLTNGTLLRSTGSKVNGAVTFTADLAGNASLDSLQGIAMATTDVLDGTFGVATLVGQVNELNTTAFSDNDLLWVGHAGGYVNTSPEAPLWSAIFGRVVYADADSGAIYMFPIGETKYNPNPTFTARFEDSTEVITNTGIGLYELVTSATNSLFGEIRNVGFTFQGDSISPLQDGNYTTFFSYSFQGTAAQTDLYRIAVYVNGVKQYSTSRTASGANNGGVPFPYTAFLTAGDWISFRVANLTTGVRDCTFTDGTITINFSQ